MLSMSFLKNNGCRFTWVSRIELTRLSYTITDSFYSFGVCIFMRVCMWFASLPARRKWTRVFFRLNIQLLAFSWISDISLLSRLCWYQWHNFYLRLPQSSNFFKKYQAFQLSLLKLKRFLTHKFEQWLL